MSSRGRLLTLLRSARRAAAPSSRRSNLPPAAAGAASSSGSESNDANFSGSSNRRSGSTFGAILIGQAAIFLSLSNSVLAQDDSDAPATTTSEQADEDVTSLRRIENGSVIINEHTVKWRIFTNKARYFFLKGSLDEAEKFLKAALHEAKEGFGPRDPHAASALNNLAEFYRLRKEYKKAEPLYLEATEILEQSFGPGDIRVGRALHKLGQYYHIQGRFEHAQSCYEGSDSLDTTIAAEDLGITLRNIGKVKESEELWERCLAVRKKILSEDHIQLEALQIVGLLDTGRIAIQAWAPAKTILLLKLPLEHMKHGYFKIDAAGISDTCRLFIWPNKHLRGVQYTTLRIHFHKFEKFDYQYHEQALGKCISLYNEPHTRKIVLNALRQRYLMCLRSLISHIRYKPDIFNAPRMKDLLAESQQILKELGEEDNMK